MNAHLLRIGAAAAILGVIVQLAAAMVEPARVGDADKAIRTIADSGGWTGRWLVHLAGILLLVIALSVVTRTFSEGTAKEWARVGQPLFVVAGALGVAEVVVGGSTKDLADGWAAAAPQEKLPYTTAFEGQWNVTVDLDFGAILVLALYLATLAAAILAGNVYARWLGWTAAVAAPLVFVGILLELRSPVGTALGLVGNVLFFVVLIGLGVTMWRKAAVSDTADLRARARIAERGLGVVTDVGRLYGAAQESNLPSRGLHDRTGFEDLASSAGRSGLRLPRASLRASRERYDLSSPAALHGQPLHDRQLRPERPPRHRRHESVVTQGCA